jgi:hypothetical protein
MALPLEKAGPGVTWDVAEMVENELTNIAVRLYDLGTARPELKELTESIRNNVFMVRNAVDRTWGESRAASEGESKP